MQKFLFWSVIALFAVQIVANIYDWYYTTNIDLLMHFLGGAWVGLLFYYVFVERWPVVNARRYPVASLMLACAFGALMGVSWEVHEFLVEILIIKRQDFTGAFPGSLFDSLKDLVNDMFGAGVAGIAYLVWRRKRD